MIKQLIGKGVDISNPPPWDINADLAGTAHKPWAHGFWTLPTFPKNVRDFTGSGIPADLSVPARKAAGDVVADPGEDPGPYNPINWP